MSEPQNGGGATPPRKRPGYRILAFLAATLIILMIGVTCVDVIGRYVLNKPFGGAFELTQILLAALVFTAMPLTSANGSHVEVDLVLHIFRRRVQYVMGRIAGVVSAMVLAYFCWRLLQIGMQHIEDGTRSASLYVPMAPLAFFAAASCAVSAVISLFVREAQ